MCRPCWSAKHRDSNPEQADVQPIASKIHEGKFVEIQAILDQTTNMDSHCDLNMSK